MAGEERRHTVTVSFQCDRVPTNPPFLSLSGVQRPRGTVGKSVLCDLGHVSSPPGTVSPVKRRSRSTLVKAHCQAEARQNGRTHLHSQFPAHFNCDHGLPRGYLAKEHLQGHQTWCAVHDSRECHLLRLECEWCLLELSSVQPEN